MLDNGYQYVCVCVCIYIFVRWIEPQDFWPKLLQSYCFTSRLHKTLKFGIQIKVALFGLSFLPKDSSEEGFVGERKAS